MVFPLFSVINGYFRILRAHKMHLAIVIFFIAAIVILLDWLQCSDNWFNGIGVHFWNDSAVNLDRHEHQVTK